MYRYQREILPRKTNVNYQSEKIGKSPALKPTATLCMSWYFLWKSENIAIIKNLGNKWIFLSNSASNFSSETKIWRLKVKKSKNPKINYVLTYTSSALIFSLWGFKFWFLNWNLTLNFITIFIYLCLHVLLVSKYKNSNISKWVG